MPNFGRETHREKLALRSDRDFPDASPLHTRSKMQYGYYLEDHAHKRVVRMGGERDEGRRRKVIVVLRKRETM